MEILFIKGLPSQYIFTAKPGKASYVENLSFTLKGLKNVKVK